MPEAKTLLSFDFVPIPQHGTYGAQGLGQRSAVQLAIGRIVRTLYHGRGQLRVEATVRLVARRRSQAELLVVKLRDQGAIGA